LTYAANPLNLINVKADAYKFFKTDIADSNSLNNVLAEIDTVDCVVNFAAESHVDRSISNSTPFIDSNIKGVANLLDGLKHGYFHKLVQVSTDEVYGTISSGSWDENAPIQPRSPYSASKASGDLLCLAYKNTFGLDITITRCSNNFGARQSVEKFVPNSISKILDGRKIPVYGDGNNRREWVHVLDHVSAIMKLVEATSIKHTIYNIGGVELSNIEIAQLIAEKLGEGKDSIEFVIDRLGHDFRYSVNYAQISTEFNWLPASNLTQNLNETIDWYVSNPKWIEASKLGAVK
jgi:dTDP-glucose 4,6-dehydratase